MDDLPLPANRTMFDQQPIGNVPKLMIDEYPPDFDPSNIQAKTEPLPIAKRLASKVWKTRKQAFEELLKIVSTQNHREFCEHQSVIVKSMTDSNIQCQVLATKILCKYLEKEGSYDGEMKVVLKNVIEKLMVIEKDEIQNLGIEVLFWMMDHNYHQMLLIELNEYLTNKNPKIVGASLKVIQILTSNYGPKKLGNLEIFEKNLKLMAEMARPIAKPQSIELFKQLFKWMGESIFSSFALHHEVKDQVSKWSKTYQMQSMEIKRGLKKGEEGKKVNPMEEQQQSSVPVDILHHYDSRWVDTTLEIVKWQEKKQHLQEFIKKTNVSVIVPRETSHYIQLIKRLFTQNNINLLQCGFKIVKNLCKGLKKAFAISCKSFLPYVYLKLKDNKAMIVDETLATLKVMTNSITLEDLQQQITEGLKDKSPQMKLNTLKLLKDLGSKKEQRSTKILKTLLGTLISLTNDSTSEVRDVALSVLCKIKEHHGMIFFEDKLEGMPQKKVNQIKSTPTIQTQDELMSSKMQIEESSINLHKSNSTTQLPTKNNPNVLKKENKMIPQPLKKKPTQIPASQPQINLVKQAIKPIEPIKTSYQQEVKQNRQQQVETTLSLPTIQQEIRNMRDSRSEEQQMMEIRNEQWPIVPTPTHVHRLMTLFVKLGEPFATLATPFKLKLNHVEILQNCENLFMTQNADLLLKWALWRIQVENPDIIEKITSVVIHLIYLLKTSMSDTQTLLIMSILSNLLESDFSKNQMLRCINTSILQISDPLRQKVFNFWITTLNESNNSPDFCEKILNLLRTTFLNIQFSCSEIVAMARVEPLVRSKSFMEFLLTKTSREFLKVSGFKLEEKESSGYQWLLKQSESQFCSDISVDQRICFFQIFKKTSHQAIREIQKLEESCPPQQLMNLHIKIMQTIMMPYLGQSLQTINVYNYFKLLTARITHMSEPFSGQIDFVIPYLRNLMRLLMFFLIDLSESRLDNKDELVKTVNKIILVLLEKMPADHLLEVMTMLLKYSIKNKLVKKLSQLLMKCIQKSITSPSFAVKAQKNVKLLFNFFISLIQQYNITDEDPLVKTIKSIFLRLISIYKELCIEIVIQKLNQFNGTFMSQEIQQTFKNFIGFVNKTEDNEQKNLEENKMYGQQSSSNNQVGLSSNPIQTQQQSGQQTMLQPSNIIRQATNIQRKSEYLKGDKKPLINNLSDFESQQGLKILQERKRVQSYHGLCQSIEGLIKMKEELSVGANSMQQNKILKNNEDTVI